MSKRWPAGVMIAIGAAMLTLAAAFAGESNNGEWSMQRSERPDAVSFTMRSSRGVNSFHTTSDWPKSEFVGLDLSRGGAQEVNFTVTRDAGKFKFEGALRNGVGGGTFQFLPDARYVQEMKALGFGGVERHQMAFAIHDVSLKFARDMKDASLQGLDSDKLMAFRIHGVSREFIEGFKAAGLNERDSDNLIAFRIHGVTPELVRHVRSAGYEPESKDLVAMRIHGATPEWMDKLKQRGYADVGLEQLVAFRIHNVTPDFIGELQKLGYEHPRPEQLIALRIHGVTPAYIGEMQGRGLKDLTLDKLVAMKIHGLD